MRKTVLALIASPILENISAFLNSNSAKIFLLLLGLFTASLSYIVTRLAEQDINSNSIGFNRFWITSRGRTSVALNYNN